MSIGTRAYKVIRSGQASWAWLSGTNQARCGGVCRAGAVARIAAGPSGNWILVPFCHYKVIVGKMSHAKTHQGTLNSLEHSKLIRAL